MGNLHGWGGPLSQNWLDQQLTLQKKILSRMIELGMVPGNNLFYIVEFQLFTSLAIVCLFM
jgi:hypothetical protein